MFSTAVLVPHGSSSIGAASLAGRLVGAGIAALTTVAREGTRHPADLSAQITRAASESDADMIVVGCPIGSLAETIGHASAAMPTARRPVLIVPTGDLIAFELAARPPAGLLDHVVVLADYAFGASCAHACATRLATQGAVRVTLQHVHGLRPPGRRSAPARRELEWIDFVNVEVLKDRLLQAGAQLVSFAMDESRGFALPAEATLVVLSAHCAGHMVELFADQVTQAAAAGIQPPAVLIPPGPCCGA